LLTLHAEIEAGEVKPKFERVIGSKREESSRPLEEESGDPSVAERERRVLYSELSRTFKSPQNPPRLETME